MAKPSREQLLEKYEGEEFPIQVIGRHLDVTEAMKNYALDKLKKARRFGGRIIEAMVVMDIQKFVHMVDFILNVNNTRVKVSGRSSNMYASVDEAIFHLESKLRRYMGRLHMHNAKGLSTIEMSVNVVKQPDLVVDQINDEIEEENLRQLEVELKPHQVISEEKMLLKILNKEEAIMKMELAQDHFLVYRSEEDRKLKVMFRREDGNFGIIAVE